MGLPARLVLVKKGWSRCSRHEAAIYSFGAVLLAVMIGGFAMNELLPLIGVSRPLGRVPVLVATDLSLLVLAFWHRRCWHSGDGSNGLTAWLRRLTSRDRVLLAAAVLLVFGAVAGAVRLNNGASGTAIELMLCLAALLVVALIRWRWQVHPTTILVTIYLFSLALLLMTSLRGWGITGHDIQREFHVFELTSVNGNWDIARFRDAYNACLSITILPTMTAAMSGVPDAYVFKLLFQLVFALCPVLVYLIARRFASTMVALLSAVYFASFPTYFTDMPFLCRQEMAYVFLGSALLVITNPRWTIPKRRVWFGILSFGVMLSHYSTTYVLIVILVIAWAARSLARLASWIRTCRQPALKRSDQQLAVVGLANIVLLIMLTVFWTGPATHTGGQLEETATRLVNATTGTPGDEKSSDVSYYLFSANRPSAATRLAKYADKTIKETIDERAAGIYYPLSTIERDPTPVVGARDLQLTFAGRALHSVGIDVSLLNLTMRQGIAKLLQIFVCLGLLMVLLGRAPGMRVSREFFFLAVGSLLVVLSQVLLPAVSVDYGLLRAFHQSLFVLAPFLAVGSIQMFGWLGRRRATVVAVGITVAFFLSLTGVLPQALGGYPAQLHLNNSGQYYDLYYIHPQERAAISWLQDRIAVGGNGNIQSEVTTDRYTFNRVQEYAGIRSVDDIYPTLVRRQAYVFLGSTNVRKKQASVFFEGDLITYYYPTSFLDEEKDLLYSNGGAAIYR